MYLLWALLARWQIHFLRASFRQGPGEPVSYPPLSPSDSHNQLVDQTGLSKGEVQKLFFLLLSFKPVVLNYGCSSTPSQGTFNSVSSHYWLSQQGGCYWHLVRWRLGMLLNISHCTGYSPSPPIHTTKTYSAQTINSAKTETPSCKLTSCIC